MKFRLFFLFILLVSTYFGVTYFLDFIHVHPYIHNQLGVGFAVAVVLSIVLQMCGHVLRAAKSKLLIDDVREAKVSTLFKGLSVGYLFNSLLPLRLGEFIRAFYVGDALSISKTTVFMSVVIERVVDGVILSICFLTAGIFIKHISHTGFILMTRFGAVLFMFSLLLLLIIQFIRSENRYLLRAIHTVSGLFNRQISDRLRFMSWSAIYGTRLMLSNKQALRKYWLASIAMWGLYFASTASLTIAFFHMHVPSKVWYVVQSSYAAVSSPIGPGYVGTFSSQMTRFLTEIGVSSISSFAILTWVVIVTPISLVGIVVLIKQRLGEKRSLPKKEVLINKLYRDRDISPEFGHFLDAYFNGERINQLLTQAELAGTFRLIKSFKGGSNAHTMLVWQNDEMRVKKITLPQYADKLKEQASWLLEKKSLKHLPKVIDQETTDAYYSFDITYYEDYFPFFDFIHNHTAKKSYNVLEKVVAFMNKSIYQNNKPLDEMANLQSYIKGKIHGKITDTAAISGEISQLVAYKKIKINGKNYDNILQVVEKIKKNKTAMKELASYNDTPIHGDLTIDNIVVDSRGDFFVLDPNNENQVSSPVVDYGKLYQSLHSGYEFLIQLETCKVRDNVVDYEEAMSQKYAEIFKLFDTKLKLDLNKATYRTILFHEAVHYCRMLTYRANINPKTVAVFYGTAVKLFNEFLNQYEKS